MITFGVMVWYTGINLQMCNSLRMFFSQPESNLIATIEQHTLKVKSSLLQSNQTLLIIPPQLFSFFSFQSPLAPSGIFRDPLTFCLKNHAFVSNEKITRMENVLEQIGVILLHNYFAWKRLFKSLNV